MLVKEDAGSKPDNCYQRFDGDKLGNGCRSWSRTLPSALALLMSIFSLVSCLYLNVKSSELQTRMWAVEHGKSGEIYHVPGLSVDQLNSIVQEKVDRLLSQRSYEHMAKIRISREVPADCNCPAAV
ncbi:collagen alpha-1(XXV) chain-like [Hyperolius riggenbachi]|uniref:collagen alpha-1(XXV) chain-like n=1 Tax=Hyperolius riggenbachi TaxID=752182 RepID=UPI0035A3D540